MEREGVFSAQLSVSEPQVTAKAARAWWTTLTISWHQFCARNASRIRTTGRRETPSWRCRDSLAGKILDMAGPFACIRQAPTHPAARWTNARPTPPSNAGTGIKGIPHIRFVLRGRLPKLACEWLPPHGPAASPARTYVEMPEIVIERDTEWPEYIPAAEGSRWRSPARTALLPLLTITHLYDAIFLCWASLSIPGLPSSGIASL